MLELQMDAQETPAVAQAEQQAAVAREAAQRAQEAVEEEQAFRVDAGGVVVQTGPGGVNVMPTTTAQPGVEFTPEIPPEAVAISIAFFIMLAVIIIGWPLARAFARRMDRATVAPQRGVAGDPERLVRIEQAVEAMAVEVERISENQRFVTKLLTEGRSPDAALIARASVPAPEPDRH